MMSDEFEIFLKEYNSIGSDKLKGYSIENLMKMSPRDKLEAAKLLRDDVLKNLNGVEALSFLDVSLAISALHELEEKSSAEKNMYIYEVYYWLWILDNKEVYADKFCKSFTELPVNRRRIFYSMAKKMINSPAVDRFIKSSIFFEADKGCVGTAATAILNKHGLSSEDSSTKDKFIASWRVLTNGATEQKKSVLAQLLPITSA